VALNAYCVLIRAYRDSYRLVARKVFEVSAHPDIMGLEADLRFRARTGLVIKCRSQGWFLRLSALLSIRMSGGLLVIVERKQVHGRDSALHFT